ncbi:MAG: DUF4235 domain-containing protein [Nocardioidaceae bacterium]|nr:MAG: DUF4235 domain-containing protein [Nocardioidaceae bacterium]
MEARLGQAAPTDPTDPNIAIREVILWSVISGAVMGLARTLVYRRLALNARKQRSLAQGTRPK